MEETYFVGIRQFQTFMNGTELFWVKNYTNALGEAMVPPIFHQKAEVPRGPESFQVGVSGCPAAHHEDLGADEVSQGC